MFTPFKYKEKTIANPPLVFTNPIIIFALYLPHAIFRYFRSRTH